MPLVSTSDLAVHYGADIIFSGVDVDINVRARIGIVGPNGGGKTSLLKVLMGAQLPLSIHYGIIPVQLHGTL